MESGLGLCCEEAGRLILGWKEKVGLVESSDGKSCCEGGYMEEWDPVPDDMLEVRDEAIRILQDRNRPMPDRIQQMLEFCDAAAFCENRKTVAEWAEFLKNLERLDERWTDVLDFLTGNACAADFTGFDLYMAERQTEYEQFAVYLIYRHMINAFDEADLAARAAFAA